MIYYHHPPIEDGSIAIFCDLENIVDCSEHNQQNVCRDLGNLLAALRIDIHRANLRPHPHYSWIYAATSFWHTSAWEEECTRVARAHKFSLRWTLPRTQAERVMECDIADILHQRQLPELPRLVLLMSGDGDLVPLVDQLRAYRHEVCVAHNPRATRGRMSSWLSLVANGVINLNDILPSEDNTQLQPAS